MRVVEKVFLLSSLLIFLMVISSCDDFTDSEKYQRPKGLEGKLFEQISSMPSSSIFLEALTRTQLQALLSSGYFTVFVPTDSAFSLYLRSHDTSIETIDVSLLEQLLRTHIIQNGWRESQLTGMISSGWVDTTLNYNNVATANKRQSVYLEANREVYVKHKADRDYVVLDSLVADKKVMIVPDARQYMTFYFDDFFTGNRLSYSDFSTYTHRDYEKGEIFFFDAKLTSPSIASENGFVYEIDRVVEPQASIEQQMLYAQVGKYDDFLSWLYEFSDVSKNEEATLAQQQSSTGGVLQDLYDLKFYGLGINQQEPFSKSKDVDENMSMHMTQMAPTNEGFDVFRTDLFTGKNGRIAFDLIPQETKTLLLKEHYSYNFAYQTNIDKGFYNANRRPVLLSPDEIEERQYCSNGVFIGLSKPLIPRAFMSCAAPVVLLEDYKAFFYAMNYSNIMDVMDEAEDYFELYVIDDYVLDEDSSLAVEWTDPARNEYDLAWYNDEGSRFTYSAYEVKRKLMHQMVVEKPLGGRRKEFLRNALGNYIVYSDYSGALPFSVGESAQGQPVVLQYEDRVPVDNGVVYKADDWFAVNMTTDYDAMGGNNKFTSLLIKTGIIDPATTSINTSIINQGEYYTVFVPTDSAITASGIETLSVDELRDVLLYHFVRGSLVFTDGRHTSGLYDTYLHRKDANGKVIAYEQVHLTTGVDVLSVTDQHNVQSHMVEGSHSNKMISYDIKLAYSDSNYDWIVTGVAHRNISSVLLP